jgi:hypothetical protein
MQLLTKRYYFGLTKALRVINNFHYVNNLVYIYISMLLSNLLVSDPSTRDVIFYYHLLLSELS